MSEWSNLGIGGMDGSSHLEKLKHLRSYHSTWMLVGSEADTGALWLVDKSVDQLTWLKLYHMVSLIQYRQAIAIVLAHRSLITGILVRSDRQMMAAAFESRVGCI